MLPLPTVLPTLQGRRIALRAMEDSDTAGIHAIYSDPLVMRYTDEDPFPDRQATENDRAQTLFRKRGYQRDPSGMLAIRLATTSDMA